MDSPSLPQAGRPLAWYNEFVPHPPLDTLPSPTNVTVDTSILCAKCQPIQSWLKESWEDFKTNENKRKQYFHHYGNALQLKQSYLDGCHLCTLFWHSFDNREGRSPELRISLRNGILERVDNGLSVRIIATNTELSAKLVVPGPRGRLVGGRTVYLKVGRNQDHDRSGKPIRPASPEQLSPISSKYISTMSEAASSLVKEWISECSTSHSLCRKGRTSILPQRLIDVACAENTDQVRLVSSRGMISMDIQYAVLSYRWGPDPTFTLKEHTEEEFRSGRSIETFPKTIQDAVYFTRKIGLKWLWVDALCIVQDSKEDLSRELASMYDIYQNSFISIAALGASSSNDGLYAQRDPLLYTPCFLFRAEDGFPVYVGLGTEYNPWVDTWPLHTRGWVVQERILPPRTINFGAYLIWQCRTEIHDEYNMTKIHIHSEPFDSGSSFFDYIILGNLLAETSGERDQTFLHIWRQIVVSYTESGLTVTTDRLSAISGILAAFQKRTGWSNLAGLWEPFLWNEILWRRFFTRKPSSVTGLSPTWSWISVTGGVEWPDDSPSQDYFLNAVSHVHVGETINSSVGSTEAGRLSLRVSCIPVKMKRTRDENTMITQMYDLVDWPGVHDKNNIRYEPDCEYKTRVPELFLPIVAGSRNNKGMEIIGLAVVQSSSCAGAFERVGFFTYTVSNERKGNEEEMNEYNRESYEYLNDLGLRKTIILV